MMAQAIISDVLRHPAASFAWSLVSSLRVPTLLFVWFVSLVGCFLFGFGLLFCFGLGYSLVPSCFLFSFWGPSFIHSPPYRLTWFVHAHMYPLAVQEVCREASLYLHTRMPSPSRRWH